MALRYLHMLPIERDLWSRWMSRYGSKWNSYQYDIRVGRGIDISESYDIMTRRLAKILTQKRIDVTAKRQGILWIFEVKPHAGLSALGQLLAYRDLYRRDFKYQKEIRLGLVTDLVNQDETWLYKANNIKVFIV